MTVIPGLRHVHRSGMGSDVVIEVERGGALLLPLHSRVVRGGTKTVRDVHRKFALVVGQLTVDTASVGEVNGSSRVEHGEYVHGFDVRVGISLAVFGGGEGERLADQLGLVTHEGESVLVRLRERGTLIPASFLEFLGERDSAFCGLSSGNSLFCYHGDRNLSVRIWRTVLIVSRNGTNKRAVADNETVTIVVKPPVHYGEPPDYAKRASDIINGYRTWMKWEELQHKWVAIRLEDGGSDGTLYDSLRDAKFHQGIFHQRWAYISYRNLVGGTNPHEMWRHIDFTRMAYDAGMRLPDPEDVRRDRELPGLMIPFGQADIWRKLHASRHNYS